MSDDGTIEDIRQRKIEQLRERETASAAPSDPLHVESADQFADAVESYEVVLVDFYADWCGPCQMLSPVVEQLAAETDAAVAKVDVDAHQSLAAEYGVQGVPTLVLFADGQPVERMVGVKSKAELADYIDRYSGSQ